MTAIPKHILIALANLRRAFESDDTSTLGTINEALQPVADAAIAWQRRSVQDAFEAGRRQGHQEALSQSGPLRGAP